MNIGKTKSLGRNFMEYRPEKTQYLDTFHAVIATFNNLSFSDTYGFLVLQYFQLRFINWQKKI